MTDLILLNRKGGIEVKPGYDGVYGRLIIGGKEIAVGEDEKPKGDKANTLVSEDKNKKVVQKKLF